VDKAVTQDIIDKYDAFILDQFGVLHNGATAIEGAIELVDHLAKKENKKLIVLSNTSAPAHKAKNKLPKLGFDPNDFCGIVTSGEEAAHYIRETYNGKKALVFSWDTSIPNSPRTATPQAFLEYCDNLQAAESVEEADFLLLQGSEAWYRGENKDQVLLDNFVNDGNTDGVIKSVLEECLKRGLPCVSANPDVIVQNKDGSLGYMPGKIGLLYKEMGGDVRVFGKPEKEHFLACLRTLGLPADRVCHVGDSLHHDILGANSASVANIFVTSGIHRNDLKTEFGVLPPKEDLDDLVEKEGIVPTHVVSAFRL